MLKVVIDTNVFIAALMSQRGAAYRLFMMLGTDQLEVNISVPLILEYESIATRLMGTKLALDIPTLDDILDFVCASSVERHIYFYWRPFLNDSKDDMLLELAVSSGANYIVTYNQRDFIGVDVFGIVAITPKELLDRLDG